MKAWKRISVAVLAMIMAAMPTTQAMAASNVNYLDEIRVGYGDEGKAALENAGYTVWKDLDANKGGNGSSVWLGYKTTADANDAITDIAVMNMEGGYSFDAYTEELSTLNQQVDNMLSDFSATIEEFRRNYENGNPYTADAVAIMNTFYDEDVTTDDGSYMGIGNLIIDPSTTEDTLHTILLEGNTQAVVTIETALAIGCIETGDENVLTRLEQVEYPDELSTSGNAARENLASAFDSFQQEAQAAEKVYEDVNESADSLDEYLSENEDWLSDSDISSYTTRYAEYQLLDNTAFGADEDMTLLDFAMMDKTELTDEYLDMMAQAMTPGQLGVVNYVGLMTILTYATAGSSYGDAENALSSLVEAAKKTETISVFFEVDRDLFENSDGIAMTSDALREKAAAEVSTFGRDESVDHTKATILSAVGAGTLAAGLALTSYGAAAWSAAIIQNAGTMEAFEALQTQVTGVLTEMAADETGLLTTELDFMPDFFTVGAEADLPMVSSASGAITTVIGVVAIIAAIVMIIFAIISWMDEPVKKEIEYTEIPRAIVELADDNRSFIGYYAAKLITASDDKTDSLEAYGDLNALNGSDQWVALYYTKNKSMGSPITTDMLVRSSADASINTNQYTAIHNFGEAVAANLNQYNTGSGAAGVYVYLRTVTNAAQSGSVFTTGTVLTGVASFLVGGGIAAAATYTAMRKKKVEAVAQA